MGPDSHSALLHPPPSTPHPDRVDIAGDIAGDVAGAIAGNSAGDIYAIEGVGPGAPSWF